MITIQSIQLATTAQFNQETAEAEPEIINIRHTGAQIEGRWYGNGGSLGIPFTEELEAEELEALGALLVKAAARVWRKKQTEDLSAALIS